jgi:hypothetical protein
MALHDPGRVYVRPENINDWRVFILLDGSARWRAWGVNCPDRRSLGMYVLGRLKRRVAASPARRWR